MDVKLLGIKEKKVAIQAELITGANPRKLAEKYDIHYTTVIKYRNEQREGVVNTEVLDVADADATVLRVVAEKVKAEVAEVLPPKKAEAFADKVDDLVVGVSSLQLLDTSFHETITKLLNWANAQINDDMSLKEWMAIAGKIGELHTAVFAKGGVSVNVQQNNNATSFSTGMVN